MKLLRGIWIGCTIDCFTSFFYRFIKNMDEFGVGPTFAIDVGFTFAMDVGVGIFIFHWWNPYKLAGFGEGVWSNM